MYFPLPSGVEDKIVRNVETHHAPFLPNTLPNPDFLTGRRLMLAARKQVRIAARNFNRRLHHLFATGSKEVAGLKKDENVASELALQAVVRRMTAYQRNQWARKGYPGLQDVPRRPERAANFLEFNWPEKSSA